MVSLIVGLLIFLTIDWRLDIRASIWRPGRTQGTPNVPNLLVKVMLIATFIFADASVLSALFLEYLGSVW
jgi:hypothetical protein